MLRILGTEKMTIMIPTENVEAVGLRRVIGKDTVDENLQDSAPAQGRGRYANLEPPLSRVHGEDQNRFAI